MGNSIHIWSDIPGDWRLSSRRDAQTHGHQILQVVSIPDLVSAFGRFRAEGVVFDEMDFHTHGGPGGIALGSDSLDYLTMQKLEGLSFDKLFARQAMITFTGCNVAEGAQGEYFLVRAGKALLRNGGGKVLGSTGAGLADPIFSGDVYHPFGDWVTATIGPGGTATLRGHKYLIPKKLRERISQAQSRMTDEPRVAATEIAQATTYLASGSEWDLMQASLWLDQADKKIAEAIIRKLERDPKTRSMLGHAVAGPKY
jgi:hypothetical protein